MVIFKFYIRNTNENEFEEKYVGELKTHLVSNVSIWLLFETFQTCFQGKFKKQDGKKWSLSAWSNIIGTYSCIQKPKLGHPVSQRPLVKIKKKLLNLVFIHISHSTNFHQILRWSLPSLVELVWNNPFMQLQLQLKS